MIRQLALAVLVCVAGAGPARADMIAGWDFSQYFTPFLSIDGVTTTNTLSANYSNLVPGGEPARGAGPLSAPFGTLYMDGSFGSTNVDPNDDSLVEVRSGSIPLNLEAPVLESGFVPFDSETVLIDQGQELFNLNSLQLSGTVDIVFHADLSSDPLSGTDWELTFAAQTFAGTSDVVIAFSTDGASYTNVRTEQLGTSAEVVTQAFDTGSGALDSFFVRLSFAPSGVNVPFIDNVAIDAVLVPEPATATLLLVGLMGLGRLGARRGR